MHVALGWGPVGHTLGPALTLACACDTCCWSTCGCGCSTVGGASAIPQLLLLLLLLLLHSAALNARKCGSGWQQERPAGMPGSASMARRCKRVMGAVLQTQVYGTSQ
eukprot:352152-Chlamydomonas_euryale.AAC.5